MDGFFKVAPIFSGVDRPETFSWSVRGQALADRLVRAIRAGVVCLGSAVQTDANGKTYVAFTSPVLGRTLNADLKRLGY